MTCGYLPGTCAAVKNDFLKGLSITLVSTMAPGSIWALFVFVLPHSPIAFLICFLLHQTPALLFSFLFCYDFGTSKVTMCFLLFYYCVMTLAQERSLRVSYCFTIVL